jgi:hypothetical protein
MALTEPRKASRFARNELNWFCRELNRVVHRHKAKPAGFDLMAEDWDTAIILDACRFDAFAVQNRFSDGDLRRATSPGTDSLEFIEQSFDDRELHDTVYVTGNPYVTVLDSSVFHEVVLDQGWESSEKEVRAERVTDAAIDAHERHPNKRIIVHYMQPHLPILAPESRWINDKLGGWKMQYWPEETSIDALRRAYLDNLDYAIGHAKELIDTIEGRIVVTADHGELLGERQWPIPARGFDHFGGLYHPKLIEVPWLTLEKGERREAIPEPPRKEFSPSEEKKKERLAALGYI